MIDGIEIAKKRHDELAAEIGKLGGFACAAEKLVKNSGYDVEEEYDSSPRNIFPTQMHRSDTKNY